MRLRHKENLQLRHRWRLTAYYKGTKIVAKILEGENVICTVGKYQVCDMLIDVDGYDTGLTRCALGASDTTPAASDTQLGDEGGGEAMRKLITSKTRSGNVITLSTFFTAAESTLAILEAGIFGHSTAGTVRNSGIIFAHWLVSLDNSEATYDITVDYELTVG